MIDVEEYLYSDEWGILPNFSDYLISCYGEVYRISDQAFLIRGEGLISEYHHVNLRDDFGRRYSTGVHRLVAECFVPGKTLIRSYVNHLDEDKLNNCSDNLNNCSDNLEWVSHEENVNYTYLKTKGRLADFYRLRTKMRASGEW